MTKANPKTPAEPVAAPSVAASQKSTKFVTVACKVPTGLELQLQKETKWPENTPSGTIMRTRFDKVGPIVIVRGPAQPVGPRPRGYPAPPIIVGGYALTPNVDAAFFAEWMEQNKDAPYVMSKMIFAHGSRDHVKGEAADNKHTRSGFEPLDPPEPDANGKVAKLDPRMPKPMGTGISGITTAEEMAGREQLPAEDVD
jgi:hypothetical protein